MPDALLAAAEGRPFVVVGSVSHPAKDRHYVPENSLQAHAILNVRVALQHHFHMAKNVVVKRNMPVHYEQTNPAAHIAPGLIVVLDHRLRDASEYSLWREGKPPDLALDTVPPSSALHSVPRQQALYARVGIGEYFLFQPDTRRPGRRLAGFRLRGGRYVELAAGPNGEVSSKALRVSLRVEGENLRVCNLETGYDYPWIEEHPRSSDEAESNKQAAYKAAHAAFASVSASTARLEAATDKVAASTDALQAATDKLQAARDACAEAEASEEAWRAAEAKVRAAHEAIMAPRAESQVLVAAMQVARAESKAAVKAMWEAMRAYRTRCAEWDVLRLFGEHRPAECRCRSQGTGSPAVPGADLSPPLG